MGRHDGVRNPLDNGLPVNSRRSVAPHRTPAPGPLLRLVQNGAHGADDPEVVGSGPSHAEEEVCGAAGLGGQGRLVPLVDGVKEIFPVDAGRAGRRIAALLLASGQGDTSDSVGIPH